MAIINYIKLNKISLKINLDLKIRNCYKKDNLREMFSSFNAIKLLILKQKIHNYKHLKIYYKILLYQKKF